MVLDLVSFVERGLSVFCETPAALARMPACRSASDASRTDRRAGRSVGDGVGRLGPAAAPRGVVALIDVEVPAGDASSTSVVECSGR